MTTQQLETQLANHRPAIEQAIEQLGLPLHVFFLEEMEANARAFQSALCAHYSHGLVAFAAKSNPCRGAVRAASQLGLGLDAASEHEMRLGLEEGIPSDHIICNGNAKSTDYLRRAVQAGCTLAVDNQDELIELAQLCERLEVRTNVLLRFRGMPLAGLTSADQTTAADWTKFGFHIDEAPRLHRELLGHPWLRYRGVSAHIGTQIANPIGYERLLDYLLRLLESAQAMGLQSDLLDIGGGFPVAFFSRDAWEAFQARLRRTLEDSQLPSVTWNDHPMGYADGTAEWSGKAYWSDVPQAQMVEHLLKHTFPDGRSCAQRLRDLGEPLLILEPGRGLMATTAVTLTRVAGQKEVLGHCVVSLDMGINNHGTNLISPDMFPTAVLPRRSDDRPIDAFSPADSASRET